MRCATPLLRLLVGLLLAGGLGSCSMFRAQVGLGVGLGAVVKVPALVHVGLGMGAYDKVGHLYDRGWVSTGSLFDDIDGFEIESAANFIHVISFNELHEDQNDHRSSHVCFLLPLFPLYGPGPEGGAPTSFELAEPFGLELALWLGPFALHLGWNPWYLLDHDPSRARALRYGRRQPR